MTISGEASGFDHRGRCGCKWTGPWRSTDVDARNDAIEHCEKTECTLGSTNLGPFEEDDLMPHERAK